MIWFLFAVALFWVMFGTLMLFATQVAREKYYEKLRHKDPRVLSPVPIIVGILLLLSASSSSEVTFIVILGLIALLKGVLFLFAPREKLKKVTSWWFDGADRTHKIWGVISIGLGIAVLATIIG